MNKIRQALIQFAKNRINYYKNTDKKKVAKYTKLCEKLIKI